MPAYINNQFVNNEEALLHVKDLSMQRGYAVFDFFRTINGTPLFIDDHLDRFYRSASTLHLKINKSREEIKEIARELVQQSGLTEAGVRLMLTGGYSADGYQPGQPNLVLNCNTVKVSTAEDFEKGFAVITHQHQRELPLIKSINYLTAVWLQPQLKQQQANDVLYYTKEGISEFPRANVFIITAGNKLVTPARNILYGITRKNVMAIAEDIMPVIERDILIDELGTAKEIFLTSTTKKIMPIVKMNGKIIGDGRPGVFTTKLYQKFLEMEKSLVTDYTN